jgi:Tol biopolymer transport system component
MTAIDRRTREALGREPRPSALLVSLVALGLAIGVSCSPRPPESTEPAAAGAPQPQAAATGVPHGPMATPAGAIDVTVNEGTSLSVAVSPDGRTLAMDLQGTIWTLPATGGAATRITDLFNDARQPTWSPDGRWITFFAYRDGGYDLWSIAPDGSNQHKLTWGAYDDREPAWSHDGTRVAFSSDRREWASRATGDYNIWVLDTRTGALQQLTTDPAEDFMPTWSPDDRQIAFISERGDQQAVWVVPSTGGTQRKVSNATGNADAPSWGPGGQIVYHAGGQGRSQLEVDGKNLTGTENAFAFRVSWASPTDFFYVSDGKIRKRSLTGDAAQTVEFTASLKVTPASYTRKKRDFDSKTPRQVVGIVRPAISPDGTRVAFAALNDIYVMPIGGKPENLTNDRALDTDPAWSPDGSQLAYSSDRGGDQLQIWLRDMKTGQSRQLTKMDTQPQGAAWSPDGTKIAVFNVTGMWRVAEFSVIDVATGAVTKVHDTLPQPGAPTWSPDGKRLAIAGSAPYSTRFREGTNQILTMSATAAGDDVWYTPVPMLGIDSRGGGGPVWSPDGSKMAAIYEGMLAVWPVSATGEPVGPIRRVTNESANSPSWQGDSRHILYLNFDKLKVVDVETGDTRDVPLDLKYTVDVPDTTVIVHAGRVLDMKSPTARTDVDIVIVGNRIKSVEPHSDSRHSGGQVIDASNQTAMPGLIEFHSHLQPDFGEAQGRAWLAFGITGVRSPGGVPYEAAEEREAGDAGLRIGPRNFTTGHLMEYGRVYYKMGIAISSPAHLELELQRAQALQYDLLKSYVRMTDLQQNRIVQFGHSIGIPTSGHEIYPAAFEGMDGTEHTSGTSRRGYSPKIATLQRSYSDVATIWGKAGMVWCPMVDNLGTDRLYEMDPSLRRDRRFALYPGWMQRQVTGEGGGGGGRGGRGGRGGAPQAGGRGGTAPAPPPTGLPGTLQMVADVYKAGARVVTGTDGPNGIGLHGELMAYTMAGLSNFEALRAGTVTPAEALNIDAGTIEAGKLADIVIVEGNPLENIADTVKVRRTIMNGRVYELEDLLKGTIQREAITTAR